MQVYLIFFRWLFQKLSRLFNQENSVKIVSPKVFLFGDFRNELKSHINQIWVLVKESQGCRLRYLKYLIEVKLKLKSAGNDCFHKFHKILNRCAKAYTTEYHVILPETPYWERGHIPEMIQVCD